MKLREIKDILDAVVLAGNELLDGDVEKVCASDLMSDVLAFAESGVLLLTGLTSSQVIRASEIADIKAVCFVSGKQPQPDAIHLAKERNMIVLSTKVSMYESCGLLFAGGLRGCGDSND